MFKLTLLHFSLCPLPLVLSKNYQEESGSIFFTLLYEVLTYIEKILLRPLQAAQSQLSQHSPSHLNHTHGPSLCAPPSVSPCHGAGELRDHPALRRGITSLNPTAMLSPTHPEMQVTFSAVRDHQWPALSSQPTGLPRLLPAEVLCLRVATRRTSHLPLTAWGSPVRFPEPPKGSDATEPSTPPG